MEQLQVYLASWDAEWNNSRCIWLPGMQNGTTPCVFGFLGCRMEQLQVYLASWDAEWNNSKCIWLPLSGNGFSEYLKTVIRNLNSRLSL